MQGLKDRGYTLHENEAEQLVSHLDTDNSGQVDYLDWLAAMIDWHKVWLLQSVSITNKARTVKLEVWRYKKPEFMLLVDGVEGWAGCGKLAKLVLCSERRARALHCTACRQWLLKLHLLLQL